MACLARARVTTILKPQGGHLMAHATPSPRCRQVGQLRQRLAHAPALPFAELLPQGLAEQVIRDQAVSFRDRLFSPSSPSGSSSPRFSTPTTPAARPWPAS